MCRSVSVPHGADFDRGLPDECAQRVDEVATFTHEPGSFLGLVEVPALRVQRTCVDQVTRRELTAVGSHPTPQIAEERCKASIEPDHQAIVAGPLDVVQHHGQLVFVER